MLKNPHFWGIVLHSIMLKTHPYFLNMPIWRPPGFMIGRQLGEGFGDPGRLTYWYVPPKFRDVIGLNDGDMARVIDTSPQHNLSTFARGLAKIAYCNAVMKYGLDGFRHLATTDMILGRYPNIAYFVGSDPTFPSPPYARGRQHSDLRRDQITPDILQKITRRFAVISGQQRRKITVARPLTEEDN